MRKFKLLLVAVVALAVVAMPSEAARPSGPTITSFTYDAACNITVTYTAGGRKSAEIDMTAASYGYTSPTDAVGGFDIWAGSESKFGPMVNGSFTAVFQLVPGGFLKKFEAYGWQYRVEGVYLKGTASPYVSIMAPCTFANYEYTVRFHDGYTSGDAGLLPALQRTAKFGQLITEPTPPTRTGFTFAGWRAYPRGYLGPYPATGYWDFTTMTMADDHTVMSAQWT